MARVEEIGGQEYRVDVVADRLIEELRIVRLVRRLSLFCCSTRRPCHRRLLIERLRRGATSCPRRALSRRSYND